MAERYNTTLNRLEELKRKFAAAKQGRGNFSSKQHREYQSLLAAHNGFADDYDLQRCLKVIGYIESLVETDSATSTDLIRLQVLKDKILEY